ncbi:hypothetical protein B0H11DRAFT_1369967 [Mycena galericulata]|nr:hypothetical protein B0H11DRAFT_1369967 [Mycena galericulata]
MSLPSRPAPASPANKQPPTKSIFRKFTTKFNRNRSRSTSPPQHNRRRSLALPQVNASTTLTSREARNAALRERGLLPPLPMSVQEQQQDMRIAIVASPEPGQESGLDRRPTAANRIKEEWEARNRERLTEFRFGGNSPAASPVQENFPAHLQVVKEVDTPLPSPQVEDLPPPEFIEDAGEPEPQVPRPPPPTLSIASAHNLARPLMQAWSDTPPDPYLLPLPPSPSAASAAETTFSSLMSAFASTPTADSQFTPMTPSFLPLPPSPSLSGVETPRVLGDCTPTLPSSPTTVSADESCLAVPPRSQSIPRSESGESSLNVPSLMLDSESQTTVSTSDSIGSFGRMRNAQLATKVRNSTIEPQAHHAISVIVESPVEERVEGILTASPVDDDEPKHFPPKALKLSEEAPARRETEPAPAAQAANKADRRKSLSVFKRGKGEGLSTMMSIRRSIGFGRAKSTGGPPAGFDPSHLPPSPTLPSEFGVQQQQARATLTVTRDARRLSVSPTMHNRGSILHETSMIEDEESRRMTEVAFM